MALAWAIFSGETRELHRVARLITCSHNLYDAGQVVIDGLEVAKMRRRAILVEAAIKAKGSHTHTLTHSLSLSLTLSLSLSLTLSLYAPSSSKPPSKPKEPHTRAALCGCGLGR